MRSSSALIARVARVGRGLIVGMLLLVASCSDRDSVSVATSQPTPAERSGSGAGGFTPEQARAAREALQRLHRACDEWATARAAGAPAAGARWGVSRAQTDFERTLDGTIYNEGRASSWVREPAIAGSYKDHKGQERSYLFGTGQTGLIVATWSREEWDGDTPRGFGNNFVVGIAPYDLQAEFHVGAGRWNERGDILRVPYLLVDQLGTFEMHLVDGKWSFHPDRGVVNGNWWKPYADAGATTRAVNSERH